MLRQTPIYQEHRGNEDGGWLAAAPLTASNARLSDRSARRKLLLLGTAAPGVLQQLWSLAELAPTNGAALPDGYAFCLRPDRYFLSLPAGAEGTLTQLTKAAADADDLVTVTDLTHGRAELWLQGSGAASILGHLCGLDFQSDVFPDLAAKESSVARTRQLILRHDREGVQTYALIGDRSLGRYLWKTIVEIGD